IYVESFSIDGFSQDLTFGFEGAQDVTFSGDIIIQNNTSAITLDTIDLTGTVTLENNAEVNLIGTDGDNDFGLVLAGTDANTINVEGGEGNDSLTIQGDTSNESYQYNEPSDTERTITRNSNQVVKLEADEDGDVDVESITVDGLGGTDTLKGPDDGATFNINGANSGDLNSGDQTISFEGMENLQGEVDNKDTFIVLAGGTISGTVDGGSTGHDIITVDDSAYTSIVFTPPWPSPAGQINYDGNILNYSGMEPTQCGSCLGDITFFVRPGDVDVVLTRNASNELVFESYGGLLKEVVNETGILSLTIYLATNVYQTVTVEELGLFEANLSIEGNPFAVQEVTFAGNVYTQGHDLKVEANYINVNANVALSTRHIDNPETANHETAASTENSGDIIFTSGAYEEDNFIVPGTTHTYGTSIEINQGAKLLSHATDPYEAGKIKLLAYVTDWSANLPIDVIPFTGINVPVTIDKALIKGGDVEIDAKKYSSIFSPFRLLGVSYKTTDIDITGSTIEGTSVSVKAESKDMSLLGEIPKQVDNTIFDIFWNQFDSVILSKLIAFVFDGLLPPAPYTVMIRGAEAFVDVEDSTIISSGDVNLEAVASVDSSVASLASKDATMWTQKIKPVAKIEKVLNFLAFSYSQADGQAEVNLTGTTSINALGSVLVKSDVTTTGSASARNTSNASSESPADPYAVAIGVSVAYTKTVSKAIVGKDVTITADGNVNVHAVATSKSSAKSGVKVYVNGLAGIGIALNFDFADILAEINGTVTAAGTNVSSTIDVSKIDYDDDTIEIAGHGFETDDHVVYAAEDKDDPDNIPAILIGGLVEGQTYRVIVLDDDTIQLALADNLDIDATGVNPGSTQTLSRRQALKFDPQTAIDPNTDLITISDHGFDTGLVVDYIAAAQDTAGTDQSAIGGLGLEESYFVIKETDDTFRLAFTEDEATAGTYIDLENKGEGTEHYLGYAETAKSFSPS
ncbi:MAG: hypothetical protein H8D34_34165, partial [Chloroflexi bacterium]|nr:hypothetical protein [Chloroflexota bacterium]